MKEYILSEYDTPFTALENVIGELVRCKNCKWWRQNPYKESSIFGLCFKHKDIAIATENADWCSWAEEREDT